MKLEKFDLVTIAGALLAIVGAFGPMINVAGLGTVAYADATEPEVYLLVAFAVATAAVLFVDKRKLSLYGAIGAWLVMLWPVISNIGGGKDDGGLLGKIKDVAADPLQAVAEKLFSNVLDFEWGGFAFLIGMIAMLVGAAMNFRTAK